MKTLLLAACCLALQGQELHYTLEKLDPKHLPKLEAPSSNDKFGFHSMVSGKYWSFYNKAGRTCYRVRDTEAICFVGTDVIPSIADIVYRMAKAEERAKACSTPDPSPASAKP